MYADDVSKVRTLLKDYETALNDKAWAKIQDMYFEEGSTSAMQKLSSMYKMMGVECKYDMDVLNVKVTDGRAVVNIYTKVFFYGENSDVAWQLNILSAPILSRVICKKSGSKWKLLEEEIFR